VEDYVVDRPDRPAEPRGRVLETRAEQTFVVGRLALEASVDETLAAVRTTVDRIWSGNSPREVLLVSHLAENAVADFRARATLLGLTALMCLPLAITGVTGAVGYSVRHRTREIGIQIALGADPSRVSRDITRRALRLATFGVLAGLGGGIVMGRAMATYLFGVKPLDAGAVLVTVSVLLTASWAGARSPARSAAQLQPCDALREP
jgi:ABC-type antimicrobial peptide transport system permease subunit